MKAKILTLFIALAMVVSLAGCQGKTGPENAGSGSDLSTQKSSSQEPSAAQPESGNFNATGYPIVNEKITLDVMWVLRDSDNMVDYNEMYGSQKLEELTNIHVDAQMVKLNDFNTKLNLMFASGEYVDVIMSVQGNVDYEDYGVTQKLLLPLDDLIDKYMPIYKERAEAEPTDVLIGLRASDGKMYSVGSLVSQNINASGHYFINKTWLDALKLEIPKTVDELTEVLRSFKTKDPNGNKKNDEIPYQTMLSPGTVGINAVFPFWGIPMENGNSYFYIDEDKQVQFAPYQPGFRKAIEWLNLLYSEGLVDVELISQDSTMVETKIGEGNSGFFTAWRLTQMPYSNWAEKNAVIMNPVAADGFKVCMPKAMEIARRGAYVTAANKYIPETMRWLDAQLETEMMFSMYYGKEGEGWFYNDKGLIETKESNAENIVQKSLNANALFFAPGKYYSSVYQMAPHRIEKSEYCKQYTEAGYMQTYSNNLLSLAPRTSDEISRCTLLETDINNAVSENVAAFITNGVTDKSWNAFIDMFKDLKVDEYISIFQKALDKLEF